MKAKKTFRELRNSHGFTSSYVAQKLHITDFSLLAKERGDRSFTAKEVQELCKLYSVNISDIKI